MSGYVLSLSILLVALLTGVASPAQGGDADAVWPPPRTAVAENPAGLGLRHRTVSDSGGGVVVTWQDGPDGGVRVQWLDDAGIQRWLPADGVMLSETGIRPAISAIETGGAIVAWEDRGGEGNGGIYVQRVGSGGAPLWNAGGVRVGGPGSRPVVLADASGGAWVAWRDETSGAARAAHVDRLGTLSSDGMGGALLGAGVARNGEIRLVADGMGDAIAVWADDGRPSRIRARQLPLGIWGATPFVVSADPGRTEGLVEAVGDGAGGVLIVWVAWEAENPQGRVQHLGPDGRALWSPGGVLVFDTAAVAGDPASARRDVSATITSDGAGGAIVAWTGQGQTAEANSREIIYLQRIDDSGSIAWRANGMPLLDDLESELASPGIVTDGAGGAIVTYERVSPPAAGREADVEVEAARIDREGNVRWRRPVYADPDFDQTGPRIVFDPSAFPPGAVIVWHDGEADDLYATKVEIATPTNDSCAQAIEVPIGAHSGTLVDGTLDGSSSCGGEISDVWYRVVAPGDGTLTVDTCGTNDIGGVDGGVDTVLSLHSACPDGGGNYELTCNDDWPASANSQACSGIDLGGFFGDSYVEKTVTLGESVLIRVSRYPDEVDGPFYLRVGFVPAPGPNDDCRNATDISGGSYIGTLVGATVDGGASCNDPPGPDLWYQFTAASDGIVLIDTCGSNDMPGEDLGVDTVISVHSSCPTGPNTNEIPGACNDDWYFGNDPGACEGIDLGADLDSALILDIVAAQSYMIRVSRYAGTTDESFLLNVNPLYDPAGYVPDGGPVAGNPLRATRLGDGSVRLQWDSSCMASDTDFVVYQGLLGDYTSHQPVTCTTSGALQWDVTTASGSHYFLVVPHNGTKEGSQGFGLGAGGSLYERPEPGSSCYPRTIGFCQ